MELKALRNWPEEEENDKIVLFHDYADTKLSNIDIMLPKLHHNMSKYKANRGETLNNLTQ